MSELPEKLELYEDEPRMVAAPTRMFTAEGGLAGNGTYQTANICAMAGSSPAFQTREIARRVVATWNACAGWPTEDLEGFNKNGVEFTGSLDRETVRRLDAEKALTEARADIARLREALEIIAGDDGAALRWLLRNDEEVADGGHISKQVARVALSALPEKAGVE